MADYYSILKKTIDGLPSSSSDIRQAVYSKARTAIEKQLRGMEPALGDDVIASQLELLEDAISKIDGEYGGGSSVSEGAVPPPPPSEPAPEPPTADTVPPPPTDTVPTAPVSDASSETVSSVDEAAALAPAPTSAEEAQPVSVAAEPEIPAGEATSQPESAPEPAPAPQPAATPTPPPAPRPAPAAPAIEPAVAAEELASKYSKKPKRSLLKRLLVPLIILLILAAGGFGLWTSKDALMPIVNSWLGVEEPVEQPVATSEEEPVTTVDDKEAVKLGSDGQDQEAEPIKEEPQQDTQQVPASTNEQEVAQSTQAESAQLEQTEQQSEAEQPAVVEEPKVQLPPGETAFLYEQGDGGSGATRTDASVAWSIVQQSPLTGFAEEPVIKSVMSVPEKSMKMEMFLSRNVDETLSASHVIDIKFDLPDNFSGVSIDNVLRFTMKATEEARGEPLVAVPVKVRDNHFLVALDNLQQAVQVNTNLLLSSNWIDINVAYANGKRALLTMEKGVDGGVVFQSAFEDWRNR